MDLAEKINQKISFLEDALMGLAVVSMLFIMMTVSLDALMRYLFNNPLQWSYDFVSLYMLVLISYLPVSATFRDGATLKSYHAGEVRLGVVMFTLWPSYLLIDGPGFRR